MREKRERQSTGERAPHKLVAESGGVNMNRRNYAAATGRWSACHAVTRSIGEGVGMGSVMCAEIWGRGGLHVELWVR